MLAFFEYMWYTLRTMEHSPVTPETQLPDLSFAEVGAIDGLRKQQAAMVSDVREQILAGTSVTEVFENHDEIERHIQAETSEVSDHAYKLYLDSHLNRDDNPALYDRLLDLLRQTSATNMDSEKWYLGDTDEDGNHTKPETSGQALVARTLAELRGPAPEEPPAAPLTPEERKQRYKEALTQLAAQRTALAKLSVERRQMIRKGSDKAEELEEAYLEAQEQYQECIKYVGALKVQKWHEDGVVGDELKAKVVATLLDEHQAFSKAEQQVLEADDSRRGRIAKWLAKKHRLAFFSAGSGIVVGFGAKWALGLAAGAAIGLTGGAALGAGAAIKSTKAILMAKIGNKVDAIRHFDKRYQADKDTLRADAEQLDTTDHAALVTSANELLQGTLDKRVEKDRKGNRNRVIAAAAIGGAAGLAGVGIEAAAEHFGGLPSLHDLTHQPGHKAPMPPHHPGPGNGHPKPPAPHHPQPPHHPAPAPTKPGVVDGYQSNVQIAHGEGYQQAVSELVAQKHVSLTDAQSWQLYEHLNNTFNGHFFTNDPSYHMNNAGQWGISHAGAAHWNPAVIHELNRWMIENGHQDKLTAATKTTKKVARAVMTGSTVTPR